VPPQPETKIQWNKVTWYSKILAVLLFVILVCAAFFFGMWYQKQLVRVVTQKGAQVTQNLPITSGTQQNNLIPIAKDNSGNFQLFATPDHNPYDYNPFDQGTTTFKVLDAGGQAVIPDFTVANFVRAIYDPVDNGFVIVREFHPDYPVTAVVNFSFLSLKDKTMRSIFTSEPNATEGHGCIGLELGLSFDPGLIHVDGPGCFDMTKVPKTIKL
jgi:hypothetical protein